MAKIKRRNFIKTSVSVAAGISVTGSLSCNIDKKVTINKLPKWKGFNILDFFSPDPANAREGIEE